MQSKEVIKAVTTSFDDLRKLEKDHDAMRSVLIYVIRRFDYEFYGEINDEKHPLAEIRKEINNVLNN
jgi:hypothetical protein